MNRGFTLIELIISLAIIGMILSLSLAGVRSSQVRSRDAKRIADLQTIQSALEQHALGDASHSYPPDDTISSINNTAYCVKYPPADGRHKGIYKDINNLGVILFVNDCFTEYLSVVPRDPKGAKYLYRKPGCFIISSGVGGVDLTNATTGCTMASGTYGLHAVLESTTNREGTADATPNSIQSYDLIP